MNQMGNLILNTRREKNMTQEELAERSRVNLRTIQRIENNENIPRESTLKLICDVLEIDFNDFQTINISVQTSENKSLIFHKIFSLFFALIINLVIVFVFGYLTIDSFANLNSNIGAIILSFFLAYLIVSKTDKMSDVIRVLKFGTGMFLYGIINIYFMTKYNDGKGVFLLFVCGIYLTTLFYGNGLINSNKR